MARNLMAPLRMGLRQLQAEKQQIDRRIMAIQGALAALGGKSRGTPPVSHGAKARRRRMSAAARRVISQRMKAYWAKRKAAPAKMKTKGAAKGQ